MEAKQGADIPAAQGNYRVPKRHRDIVYPSGMTPRLNGALTRTGRVTCEHDLADYREAVELAASNALKAASSLLAPGELLREVLTMTVFVATSHEFQNHSRVADSPLTLSCRNLGKRLLGLGPLWASTRCQAGQ